MDEKQEHTMGMLAHLASFSGWIIPFGNIIGPLIIWLMKKDESEYVAYHGRESLNFQITLTLAYVVSGILILVLIGILLLPIVFIAGVVLSIIVAIKANEGVRYEYPFCIRFIK